ncbi:(E2-independent) E3 ubiquitin-conjugating enzyme FATS isoform X2 [Mugil cephalus]|uniref:(E2-independent) E3 ubiquitin-conjugating enzyme FATS isoform X2 n=1 Tax=Mugil cephalus TaxID=48193 RepID=UPI001FB6A775|nr:(E2-independent) E3 ubiquitin-conjugating enzyme FATS isoform X2 [Mugil cephalus]
MTLRRPAARLRRGPGWRRSGDESYWESLMGEGDHLPSVSHPASRSRRPQSAIEGGQLDRWLEHLQELESKLRAPVQNQAAAFNDQATYMPFVNQEATGRACRHVGFPFSSRGSSSCGSSSLCESSLGSLESLQTGFISPPERRESWERAHIMQAPRKEQTQLSYLAPVKIGWLPIQRRVMMVADTSNQNQSLDHSAGHVKLKQPITPTFQNNRVTPKAQDGESERSPTGPGALGVRTWQTPDQGSAINKQVPEKRSFPANEADRPGGWQALRRGWTTNRVSGFPGGGKPDDPPTGTHSDPNRKSPLIRTTSNTEPLRHSPLCRTTSADPCRTQSLLRGANATEACKSHAPLQRTSSAQPVKATASLCGANNRAQLSRIQTSSAAATLVPQNKAGFSSITISSRKVSRSASLPGSQTCSVSSRSSESPSPPALDHQPMDPSSRQVMVQRKATIVKVTEKKVISSPAPSRDRTRMAPADHALDTVVHRRKATIIKVTEHSESYRPRSRHPEYRHSYTEGAYQDRSAWSQGNHAGSHAEPSNHIVNSGPNSTVNAFTSEQDRNGTLHRSTLSLFVSNPPAIAAPSSSEVPPKGVGQRSVRPHRPLSCYGSVTGNAEPSKENVTQPVARKWSLGLPQETNNNPVNFNSSFISPGRAVKEAGQPVADTLKSDEKEILPAPEDAMRRASASLTLITAPDPGSRQSQEEVLALNAAAIIANIKLQRQLTKKKKPNGDSEKDSAASPQGNSVTDERKCMRPHFDQSQARHHNQPRAAFVQLSLGAERSAEPVSLQEALQRSRPGFISRSQGRVRELERRAQERRELSDSAEPRSDAALRQRGAPGARSTSLNGNLFRSRDRAVTGKEMQQPRPKRTLAEVKRKKDEEMKRAVCLSNRQRVELFKKEFDERS